MAEMIRKTYGRTRRGFSRQPEVENKKSERGLEVVSCQACRVSLRVKVDGKFKKAKKFKAEAKRVEKFATTEANDLCDVANGRPQEKHLHYCIKADFLCVKLFSRLKNKTPREKKRLNQCFYF